MLHHCLRNGDTVWVRSALHASHKQGRSQQWLSVRNHDSMWDNFTALLGEPFERTRLVGNGGIERLVFKCRKGWECSDAFLSMSSLCVDVDVCQAVIIAVEILIYTIHTAHQSQASVLTSMCMHLWQQQSDSQPMRLKGGALSWTKTNAE